MQEEMAAGLLVVNVPLSSLTLFHDVSQALQDERLEDAQAEAIALVEARPESGLGHFLLGQCCEQLGAWKDALHCYAQAAALSPLQCYGGKNFVETANIMAESMETHMQHLHLNDAIAWVEWGVVVPVPDEWEEAEVLTDGHLLPLCHFRSMVNEKMPWIPSEHLSAVQVENLPPGFYDFVELVRTGDSIDEVACAAYGNMMECVAGSIFTRSITLATIGTGLCFLSVSGTTCIEDTQLRFAHMWVLPAETMSKQASTSLLVSLSASIFQAWLPNLASRIAERMMASAMGSARATREAVVDAMMNARLKEMETERQQILDAMAVLHSEQNNSDEQLLAMACEDSMQDSSALWSLGIDSQRRALLLEQQDLEFALLASVKEAEEPGMEDDFAEALRLSMMP